MTTKSVASLTNSSAPTTKYGVYTGSAPYIGSTPTKSNLTTTSTTGVDAVHYASSSDFVDFRRTRIDVRAAQTNGGITIGSITTGTTTGTTGTLTLGG